MNEKIIIKSACLALLAVLTGCVGYQLGSTLPSYIETIHVPTFINQCQEPLVETEATQATIREFQKDGTLRVTSGPQADLILKVTVIGCRLEPLQYERNSAKTTREYRLKITANIDCQDTLKNKTLVSKQVEGESFFDPGGDMASAKRLAIPVAARDLAHDIVESVVEAW